MIIVTKNFFNMHVYISYSILNHHLGYLRLYIIKNQIFQVRNSFNSIIKAGLSNLYI